MNEKEKDLKEISSKETYQINLPAFYNALNNAIDSNNMQSVYELSKIFTRYYFKKLNI